MMQKLTEFKGETGNSAIIVRLHTPLSVFDRPIGYKISNDIEDLTNTLNKFDLTFIEYSTNGQQSTNSFKVPMEYFQGYVRS